MVDFRVVTGRCSVDHEAVKLDEAAPVVVRQAEPITVTLDIADALAVERAKRLRAEQQLPIARGDEQTWARVTAELLGVPLEEVETLSERNKAPRVPPREAEGLHLSTKTGEPNTCTVPPSRIAVKSTFLTPAVWSAARKEETMPICTIERHDAIKRSPAAWSALSYVGTQPAYDGLGSQLELRNCTCGSTLCKTIRRALTLDEIERREREIAEREGIDYDRCRVYLRERAIRELRAEAER